jgi:ketosteroid isomerase-like protein
MMAGRFGKQVMRCGLFAVWLAMTLGLSLPVAAAEAQRETLAVVDDAWNTLRQQARTEQLAQLMAEDFVLINTDGRIQRKLDYLMYLAARPRLSNAILNEGSSTRFYGDMAIINSVSVQTGTRDGAPWTERERITRVWQWDGDSWLLVSSHASRIPPM